MQLAPNATRILGQFGVLEQVIDAGVLPLLVMFRDALTGRELTYLDVGDAFRRRYGLYVVAAPRSADILVAVPSARRPADHWQAGHRGR